tara:strand:+ start:229 stop:609 length:381 start_codon:yes stop_codon:yes gene_type:complete
MKKKSPKNKIDPNGWRKYTIVLPPDFVKGLSRARDQNGNVLSLPTARGNAIINRLAKSLSVARGLSDTVTKYQKVLAVLQDKVNTYERLLRENDIEFEEESTEEQKEGEIERHGASADGTDSSNED